MSEPRSPTREKTPAMAFSRVELTLDSGHSLPPMKHEMNLKRQDLEIMELKRLCASAHSDALKKPLEAEIDLLTGESGEDPGGLGCAPGEGTSRHQRGKGPGARPWSARPMSARKSSVQIMKTIPESKQHVRPLSSKMRGVSTSVIFGGEHDLKVHGRRKHSDVSSDTSIGSNDSVDTYYGEAANDEVSGHEIKQLWASSHDARHPVRHVVDRNMSTFWMSAGLFPQLISLHFRRSIALRKVVVYCAGARELRLHWLPATGGDGWRHLTQAMSRDAPTRTTTEFVFDVRSASGVARVESAAVRVEVVDAHDAFAVVRHLNFIEHGERAAADGGGADSPSHARRHVDGAEKRDSSLSPAASPRSTLYAGGPRDPVLAGSPTVPSPRITPGFYSP